MLIPAAAPGSAARDPRQRAHGHDRYDHERPERPAHPRRHWCSTALVVDVSCEHDERQHDRNGDAKATGRLRQRRSSRRSTKRRRNQQRGQGHRAPQDGVDAPPVLEAERHQNIYRAW
jgi:hypothetical protein